MATSGKPVLTVLTFLLLAAVFFPLCLRTQAQNATTFTSTDKFLIPQFNASIAFLANGSYSSATLENDTWIFRDLSLNDSRTSGTLRLSAEDSNVTVFSYTANLFGRNAAFLGLSVEGMGKLTANLGLNSSEPTNPVEWNVVRPGNVFLGQGDGWHLLPGNTVVIDGLTGYFSILYFSFNMPAVSGPFYVQHSIAITTAIVVAATIGVAVVVARRRR